MPLPTTNHTSHSPKIAKRLDFIRSLLRPQRYDIQHEVVNAFAPSNIALVKYWGKRDDELFLPTNSSISLSLGDKGAYTTLSIANTSTDSITLNEQEQDLNSRFAKPIIDFLDLFRQEHQVFFNVKTSLNIAHSSGLASSACGFAALTLALQKLFNWQISRQQLSMIARLGSGSASRSLYHGFVQWDRGQCDRGLDSYATPLHVKWPQLRFALLPALERGVKRVSSRQAMHLCQRSSPLFDKWPSIAQEHCKQLLTALHAKEFNTVGELIEHNCEVMHALIQSSRPAIFFRDSHTLALIEKVVKLRLEGLPLYYTQDAGHHLKLLFEEHNRADVLREFGCETIIVDPFEQPVCSELLPYAG